MRFSLFFSEHIAISVTKPTKTKIGKIYIVYAPLVLIFGGILFSRALSTSNPDALPIAIFGFLLAILFLFIAPVLLTTPQRMEELKRK